MHNYSYNLKAILDIMKYKIFQKIEDNVQNKIKLKLHSKSIEEVLTREVLQHEYNLDI